jgi:exodeoxyribonuclease III
MFQETKCINGSFPYYSFPDYNCVVHGQKSYNGVAVLVKKKYSILSEEPIDTGPTDVRLLKVDTELGTFISAYVPNGAGSVSREVYKKDFLRKIASVVNECSSERIVVGGDFNVALTDEDVQFPTKERLQSVLCREDFRDSMKEMLRESGLEDYLGEGRYTWWDYREPHKGLRIDYILVKGIKGFQSVISKYRRIKLEIFDEESKLFSVGPSDHAPIIFTEKRE